MLLSSAHGSRCQRRAVRELRGNGRFAIRDTLTTESIRAQWASGIMPGAAATQCGNISGLIKLMSLA
tara:strand:+ start:10 stop:210 length:201 start_codon:yes stop_codon:yes gene_type:complete